MDVQNDEGAATAMEAPSGNTNDNLSIADGEASCNLSVAQSEIPVISVWLEHGSTGIVAFPCSFCEYRGQPVWHRHGYATAWLKLPGDKLGHRWPHCFTETGQRAFSRGYTMRFMGPGPATKTPRRQAAPRPSPAAQRRLDKVVTYEHAERIVRAVAERDDRFFLVKVLPDESGYTDPDALCDSRSMTVRVPPHGVYLGSLISELTLLHVGGLGSPWVDAEKLRAEVQKLVLPLAKETLQ
jgi:hypothetical protein